MEPQLDHASVLLPRMSQISIKDVLQLSVAERVQLAEDICGSITAYPETIPITDAQRRELDRRLEAHRDDRSE
jgi:putative addiction module component (TIGR02574 family)